jgi:hypothetical protein
MIIYNDICIDCPEKELKAWIRNCEAKTPVKVKKSYVCKISISFTYICINVFLGGKELPRHCYYIYL